MINKTEERFHLSRVFFSVNLTTRLVIILTIFPFTLRSTDVSWIYQGRKGYLVTLQEILLTLCPLQASSYKKTGVWCFTRQNTIINFLSLWLLTLLKLFRCEMACDVSYAFFCPYKLFNACLFRCIYLTRFCFDEYK